MLALKRRTGCTFLMFSIALPSLVLGVSLIGWYVDDNGVEYRYDGYSSERDQFPENSTQYKLYSGEISTLSSMIIGVIIPALVLTVLTFILEFLRINGSCICRIDRFLPYLPVITSVTAFVAGALSGFGCVIFLIKIYSVAKPVSVINTHLYVYPTYCFYLVMIHGTFMIISAFLLWGIKETGDILPAIFKH